MKTVLGCDPGSRSFGVSLVRAAPGRAPKVVHASLLNNPVNSMLTLKSATSAYLKEMKPLAAQADGIIMERFQTRGVGSMGVLIEQVGAMVGATTARFNLPFRAIVASQWKNKWQRRHDLDLKEFYKELPFKPHAFDATFIAMYGLELAMGDLPYDLDQIVDQLESYLC